MLMNADRCGIPGLPFGRKTGTMRIGMPISRGCEEVDLSYLKDQKFVLINNGTTLRKIINNRFRNAGFHPQAILETSSYQTISTIVSYNTAVSLVPKLDSVDSAGVEFFPVKGRPYRTFFAVRKKGPICRSPSKTFWKCPWSSGIAVITGPDPALLSCKSANEKGLSFC